MRIYIVLPSLAVGAGKRVRCSTGIHILFCSQATRSPETRRTCAAPSNMPPTAGCAAQRPSPSHAEVEQLLPTASCQQLGLSLPTALPTASCPRLERSLPTASAISSRSQRLPPFVPTRSANGGSLGSFFCRLLAHARCRQRPAVCLIPGYCF